MLIGSSAESCLIEFAAVCIKKTIRTGSKGIIDKRYFRNRHDGFINLNAFAFGIINHKRIPAPKVSKEYVLPSFAAAIMQLHKLILTTFSLYHLKRFLISLRALASKPSTPIMLEDCTANTPTIHSTASSKQAQISIRLFTNHTSFSNSSLHGCFMYPKSLVRNRASARCSRRTSQRPSRH